IDFVPGMVKYGDVDALVALRAPYPIEILDESSNAFPIANAAFNSFASDAKLKDDLRFGIVNELDQSGVSK
ncbi:MAG: hypothetical protein AAGD07_11785, partial [Planctomycetota bacterium]